MAVELVASKTGVGGGVAGGSGDDSKVGEGDSIGDINGGVSIDEIMHVRRRCNLGVVGGVAGGVKDGVDDNDDGGFVRSVGGRFDVVSASRNSN